MKESTNKEKIFKSIREALLNKSTKDFSCTISPSSFYKTKPTDDLSISFAETFSQNGNSVFYCSNDWMLQHKLTELTKQSSEDVACYNPSFIQFANHISLQNITLADQSRSYNMGILLCEHLIACDGSIVFSEKQGLPQQMISLPEKCIVVGFTSQVTDTLKTALTLIKTKYTDDFPSSVIVLNTNKENKQYTPSLSIILVENQHIS